MAVRADDVDLDRDRDLVQRYQAGDPDAFDDLYRRYFDRLHGYCQRRIGDRHEAEELAQEAFVRALRAMPTFAGERRFYPWMTVIAQRLCIDHHRRRARVEPADDIDLGSVEADHDAVFAAVDHEHLRLAFERLAPRHSEVLDLREREGLSYTEIAARLDVPVSTVEALLHRARKALRREFMAVSGHNRLWAIPGLGILSAKLTSLRARVGDRVPELATMAAPVAAGVAAVALAWMPSIGSGSHPAPTFGAPAASVAHAATHLDPIDAPSFLDGGPIIVPSSAPPPTHPRVKPNIAAGSINVYVGQQGSAQAGEKARELPVSPKVGPAMVGSDPIAIVQNTVGLLVGGASDPTEDTP